MTEQERPSDAYLSRVYNSMKMKDRKLNATDHSIRRVNPKITRLDTSCYVELFKEMRNGFLVVYYLGEYPYIPRVIVQTGNLVRARVPLEFNGHHIIISAREYDLERAIDMNVPLLERSDRGSKYTKLLEEREEEGNIN